MARKYANPGTGTSRTKRGAGMTTDMASIIARAQTTGVLSTGFSPGAREMQFLDLTSVDYMRMNNLLVQGRNAFSTLPSKVRARFQNDPYQFLRFVENPDNKAEAVRLGLITEETPPPRRIHEMTEAEWLGLQAADRAAARKEDLK